jgi:hypothetical protein
MRDTWHVGNLIGGRSLLMLVAMLAGSVTAYVFADPLRRRLASIQQAVDDALTPALPPAAAERPAPVAIPIVAAPSPDGGWLATPWSTARPTENRYERVR